jgi:hypothetical protein
MTKTATQVLQEALFSSLCEAVTAFKQNAGGMPNALARDLAAVHSNTSFDSLPDNVQKAIRDGVQETLKRLQKDGYTVAPKAATVPMRRR